MTIKQKQNLLAYLDYYTGAIDGDWGTLSRQATEAFQRDYQLKVDGDFGDVTAQRIREVIYNQEEPTISDTETVGKESSAAGTFWDEIEFFDRSEFKCTCGGRGCNGFPVEPVERLICNADDTRRHFGKVAIVSSGVRCQLRNSELPGSAENSLHTRGKAMDFAIPGVSAATLEAYVRTLPEVDECYAIDESYVHMGVQKY